MSKESTNIYKVMHSVTMAICTFVALLCLLYFGVLILFMLLRWLDVEAITSIYDTYASGMLYAAPILFITYLIMKRLDK